MSGIAGIIALNGAAETPTREAVERLLLALKHRGPNAAGVAVLDGAALGVAVLALEPGAPDGPLPRRDPSGRWYIAFDGGLYNRREIVEALKSEGRPPAGDRSDEVALAAFAAWGIEGLNRLRGSYAFAVYDNERKTATLVRDPYGTKPLYYTASLPAARFASEVKPLLAEMAAVLPNQHSILEWSLYGDVMAPATMFQGILAVEPGSAVELTVGGGAPRTVRYYVQRSEVDPARYAELQRAGAQRVVSDIDQLLIGSVADCMDGGAPTGVLLSGGVDSAVVTALARGNREITAYHLSIPEDPRIDERGMAERVARETGVAFRLYAMSQQAYQQELAETTYYNEMPLWHMQVVPYHLLVKEAARDGTRILLAGDSIGPLLGAEAGRHKAWRWLKPALKLLDHAPDALSAAVFKLAQARAELPIDAPRFMSNVPWTLGAVDRFRRTELRREGDAVYAFVRDATRRAIHAGKYADVIHWLHRFHHRGDHIGSAHGIEYRNPFQDTDSVHYMLNMPLEFNLRAGTSKWALREAGARHLPRDIVFGPKMNWDLPTAVYLEPFANPAFFKNGFCTDVLGYSTDGVQRAIDLYRRDVMGLYNLVHLEVWGRLFFMGEDPGAITARIAALPGSA
ncbi:MAG TPA: asparagine synthase-related protein [Gemmatimonadales bacterium]|nr:asparagine synthase-related protein [Gemmatimonadales bacterium]